MGSELGSGHLNVRAAVVRAVRRSREQSKAPRYPSLVAQLDGRIEHLGGRLGGGKRGLKGDGHGPEDAHT
jgi:hypothetical protein